MGDFSGRRTEQRIKALYVIGRKLLSVKTVFIYAEISAQEIAKQFSADVLIQFFNENNEICNRYVAGNDLFVDDKERVACLEACQSGIPVVLAQSCFLRLTGTICQLLGKVEFSGLLALFFRQQ